MKKKSTTLFHELKRINAFGASSAFTIVELLVVIVVIGVLASIALISYAGISKKATVATIQSDLDNAYKKFKLYQIENSGYPTGIELNCITPVDSTKICLKPSSNNQYILTSVDNSISSSQFFCLTTQNTSINTTYYITSDGTQAEGTTCPTYTLTTIAGAGGTVSSGGTYNTGTVQTITATPNNSFYTFSSWSGDTGCAGSASHTITMNSNKTCTANFTLDPNWIAIGTQIWTKANLNVGTRIAGATAQTNNVILEKYCYNDIESNCTTYGGLYQWDEAMQYVTTAGAQGICSAGSHIPTDNDWKILEVYLGMTQAQADATSWRGTNQGTKLKSGGSSGLNVPLAGMRYTIGTFSNLSSDAYLWSSSESSTEAWYRWLYSGNPTVDRGTNNKINGYSVRCLGN